MARTEERLQTEVRAPAPALRDENLSRRRGFQLRVAWLVGLVLSMTLEPQTAAGVPWWSYVVSFALLGTLAATFVGLAQRKRWGAGASIVASSIFASGVFLCPATGHHAFGLWWIGELAVAVGLVAMSTTAYLRPSR